MIKSKKIIGAVIAGVMTLSSVGVVGNSIGSVISVEAASKVKSSDVRNKVTQLSNSIKKNELSIKNVPTWQKYIKEAKALNAKLPNGKNKNEYAAKISKAEQVVNSVARVNHLETSISKNAKTEKNFEHWGEYLLATAKEIAKIDKNEYLDQYNNLALKVHSIIANLQVEAEKAGIELE